MKILVAGIGNIFLGDDGFGVEVANRLTGVSGPTPGRPVDVPDGVHVAEFGIRGVHLAYELLDGYDALILIDAVPMGEPPGMVAIIEPDPTASDEDDPANVPVRAMDAHSMNPAMVLGMLTSMGGEVGRVLVVGCQPSVIEESIGLSAPVAAAVDGAVEAVLELLAELCVPSEERSSA